MPLFTPEQQDALAVAFNVVCRSAQALQDRLTALSLVCIEHNATDYDALDRLIDLVRDHRELASLTRPPVESVRRAVPRILSGEITEADRSEAVVFPCDPPREMLGGPHV